MVVDEYFYGMRADTFLEPDPCPPYERYAVEKTEEEKRRQCECIMESMYEPAMLSD